MNNVYLPQARRTVEVEERQTVLGAARGARTMDIHADVFFTPDIHPHGRPQTQEIAREHR